MKHEIEIYGRFPLRKLMYPIDLLTYEPITVLGTPPRWVATVTRA